MKIISLILTILLFTTFKPYKHEKVKDEGLIQPGIPELIIPQYNKLKDIHPEIFLVSKGSPSSFICTPNEYISAAKELQSAIKNLTGVKLIIISDTDSRARIPFVNNLIILGNRSTSKISSDLYDRFYSLMDLKYPGKNGYSVRTLHDPFGNGFSAVLVGGSDKDGVASGVKAFADHLKSLPAFRGRNLSLSWTMLTKPGDGLKIPSDIRDFETWEASEGYGSVGYFGWNSISKRMAMYYMTGNPFHAREVVRLSFPDKQALKEIDEIDGERIENKNDPLAGPYHYNATMTILFWDIIEESPVFTDNERLDITNAFARRLDHEGTTPFDKNTYRINSVPSRVGPRHGQWSALSLYSLGRYFNKYYPSPLWAQAERAGKLAFASLHEHSYVEGEADALGWYCTGIAPVLTYMILTGDRKPLENGVLTELLRGQEVLISGLVPDGNLNSAALDFFNKAVYLTGDGRWISYRERTGMDTDIFRLGQSFWPEDHIKPALPADLTGKWTINYMPEEMWKRRNTNFSLEQSFQNMSFRSAPDSGGDYIHLKGYNGAYRNPYHTYSIIELRLNGETLLKGFNNQVITSADGMVEPVVPMDAALLYHEATKNVAVAVVRVPNLPYTNWQRSLIQKTCNYVLIMDDLTFRSGNPENTDAEMLIRVETNWETPRRSWIQKENYIEVEPDGKFSKNSHELHPSDIMHITGKRNISMIWSKNVKDGENIKFFYLLGQNKTGNQGDLACMKLSNNVVALSLPEPAIAVAGDYMDNSAELMILSGKSLYGQRVSSAGFGYVLAESDTPVTIDWDFDTGNMELINTVPVKLELAVNNPGLTLNGKNIKGRKLNGNFIFEISPGRNYIKKAILSTDIREKLLAQLYNCNKLAEKIYNDQIPKEVTTTIPSSPVMVPVMQTMLHGRPATSEVIPSEDEDMICTAVANTIVIMDGEGKEIRKMNTSGDIRVLHWWADHSLLLAGCVDEQLVAFDKQGNKKWEFTSVMDPAVYEAGKPYWFKSAYPGIYGLYSGVFDKGKSRVFVGSACTLEILDENGSLVKRIPVFWGPGRRFLMIDQTDGSKNLLVGRWSNDWPTFAVINSQTMSETSRGYNNVPGGHTFVNGWSAMNRYDNFHTDLNGDGRKEIVSAINGTWNRVTIYDEDGKPLFNTQIGPGIIGERTNIRMMDVGDIDGDGKQEIVVGLSSGFVNALDHKAQKIWSKSLSSPPTIVKIIKETEITWLCVACEDGRILAMDNTGKIHQEGILKGKPIDIQVIKSKGLPLTVVFSDLGEVSGFRLFSY